MTDREAIIRLTDIVADLCLDNERLMSHAICREILKGTAEPSAPTVTREQAIAVRYAVGRWIVERGARHGIHIHATEAEMPAFFRAVADALEGK